MDINLQSLSTTPSDHECKDGDLSAMLNVIYEDGALHIIPEPKEKVQIVLQDKDGNAYDYALKDTKFYIHKSYNDDADKDDHTNWIAITSGNSGNHILWCDDIYAENQVWEEITTLADFEVNAVTFTGRIVSLVGNTTTKWMMWSGTEYKVYDKSVFNYNVYIYSECEDSEEYIGYCDTAAAEENYVDSSGNVIQNHSDDTKAYGFSKQGMAYFLEHADAVVQQAIENGQYLHKYISFGFCALRMYDGSYLSISNMFYLGSAHQTIYMQNIQGDDRLTIRMRASLHKHTIGIYMPNYEKIKDLILGVDVFLCAPSFYKKTDEMHKFEVTAFEAGYLYPWGGGGKGTLYFHTYTESQLLDTIDTNTYHRVMRIEKKHISSAPLVGKTELYIPSFDETGTTLTLEDFGNSHYGAKVTHNYNGRVNVADVIRKMTANPLGGVYYYWGAEYHGTPQSTKQEHYLWWNGNDYPGVKGSIYNVDMPLAQVIFAIHCADDGQRKTFYTKHSAAQLPLPPIIMIPMVDVESVDIYMSVNTDVTQWPSDQPTTWYKEGLQVHTSSTGNWSYIATTQLDPCTLTSPIVIKGIGWGQTGIFVEDTDGAKFHEAMQAYDEGAKTVTMRYRNSIFSSESGNPFVTKASTQVTVGDGTILALQAPTQPISQGQAGSTPLVAFTTEGIYPLYVDTSTGLFSATQPGPRDVIIKGEDGYNTEAVTSIDNAILFPTDRGLMMYAGSGTQCLTDTLINKVYDVELPHLYEVFDAIGLDNPETNKLSDYTITKGLREYLKTCKIVYDYASQKIYLYQTDGNFALVYSLKSGAWGMAKCELRQSLNSYPDALAVGWNGKLMDMYNNATTEREFFAITRPIGFGAPNTLKRVAQSIIRGLFTKNNVATAIYGSRDLQTWFMLTTSKNHYLRGRHGSPYKYYRYLILGKLKDGETIESISADVSESLNNQLR